MTADDKKALLCMLCSKRLIRRNNFTWLWYEHNYKCTCRIHMHKKVMQHHFNSFCVISFLIFIKLSIQCKILVTSDGFGSSLMFHYRVAETLAASGLDVTLSHPLQDARAKIKVMYAFKRSYIFSRIKKARSGTISYKAIIFLYGSVFYLCISQSQIYTLRLSFVY